MLRQERNTREYVSVREVETRARLNGAEERTACEERLQQVAESQGTEILLDTRFAVVLPGFDGMARVRERRQGSRVVYEWAVKEFQPRDGLTVSKAHLEHEGVAHSFSDAEQAIRDFLFALASAEAALAVDRTTTRTRSTYLHENGTTVHVDTYTERDGEKLSPPHESLEFERTVPPDASREAIQDAEAHLINTAATIGIERERLDPSAKLSGA